jgi:ABC-type multidrug transport system fused ATPase/permease subunit
VMEKGEIREVGSHGQLLQHPNGIYSRLWRMQAAAREDRGGAAA